MKNVSYKIEKENSFRSFSQGAYSNILNSYFYTFNIFEKTTSQIIFEKTKRGTYFYRTRSRLNNYI